MANLNGNRHSNFKFIEQHMQKRRLGNTEFYTVPIVMGGFGFRLIYGKMDNVVSYDQMLHFRDFLEDHGFPFPLISAFVSVAAHFLAGLSFISGIWIRIHDTSLGLLGNAGNRAMSGYLRFKYLMVY